MRAVGVVALDGPDAVELREVPTPAAGPGEVLIDVHAAGVSFPEVLLTRGLYQLKPPMPFTLGSECAGVVREVGRGADGSGLAVGDRVAALSIIGSYAESVVVPAPFVFTIPDEVSFETAAAVPLNYLTAHFALTRRGRLLPGETVLVHGAAGGVGTAAIQVAKALGARVIAVTSSPQKQETAVTAGADHAVPVQGFLEATRALTDGRGVDIVVDPVGGDRFTDSLRSLATEGRLLVIGFTDGQIPEVKVNRLLLTNTSVIGVALAALWQTDATYAQQQWAELAPMLADGRIAPPIDRVLPLESASAALRLVDERSVRGKVVLRVG